jgi:hypothetical protein
MASGVFDTPIVGRINAPVLGPITLDNLDG